ncbi:hypothetical protein ACWD4J_23630 [Streptomyces sp. NPDC002577]
MHSEPVIENRVPSRGRRRKGGNGPETGPVFVDNSGRRARLLRRLGLVVGAICVGYAAVLGMAFMGWGTSLSPSALLPFDDAPAGGPQGAAPTGAPPTRTMPTGLPTGAAPSAAPPTSAPSAAASAYAGAN